jgi:twitching motility protein PilT
MDIQSLLQHCVEHKASDLHLSAELPPMMRVDGDLRYFDLPPLSNEEVLVLIHSTMSTAQKEIFNHSFESDYSFQLSHSSRFRVNAFKQNRGAAVVFRVIPYGVPTLEDLVAPPIFKTIADLPRGLVLVTGPTGSGKTTTLAAMIDYINTNQQGHILTIEDPIEFVHQSKKCLINQRELNRDTQSFSQALRASLREDPDYILVGEMRDLETIRLALTAAETGHLVFATLHTTSAAKTIDRVIDAFPAGEKEMVRTMLSESLQAVIAQTLIKKRGGGRIAAHEILLASSAIRNLIREDKVAQMYSTLQTSQAMGMQTLDQALQHLISDGKIDRADAFAVAHNRDAFVK